MIDDEYKKAISILKLLSSLYINNNRFIILDLYNDKFTESIKIKKSLKEIYWVTLFYTIDNEKYNNFIVINSEKGIIVVNGIEYEIQELFDLENIDTIQFILEYGRLPNNLLFMTNKENFIRLLKDKLSE